MRVAAALPEVVLAYLHLEADVGFVDIGLAFQIRDDILDIEGDEALIGKPVGSDEKNDKTTYAALVGIERADRMVRESTAEALSGLHELCEKLGVERDAFAGGGDEDIFLGRLFVALIDRKK